jgi:hypothetical protein
MANLESTAKEKDWYVPAILISGLHMVTRLPEDVFLTLNSAGSLKSSDFALWDVIVGIVL